MSQDEWDAVIRVHLGGTFACSHFAAAHWRERSKAGEKVDGRIVNTTSTSGLYANPGQANYGAAKAGIAAFSQIAAKELERYGVAVNAIAPTALTRLTESVADKLTDFGPEHVAGFVAWLASPGATGISGRVFNVGGGHISVADGWRRGAGMDAEPGSRWTLDRLDEAVPGLIAAAAPSVDGLGRPSS